MLLRIANVLQHSRCGEISSPERQVYFGIQVAEFKVQVQIKVYVYSVKKNS